tara:strand:- start:5922 stop:6602 length:681 start_codon:yes stop_codon:yes gene_type:complete
MGVTLTSKTIASTYQGLLKLSDNTPLTTVYKIVTDGFGNESALRVSSIGVSAVKLYSEMDAVDIAGDANGSVVVTRNYLQTINLGGVTSVNALTGVVQLDLGFDPSTGVLTLTGGASVNIGTNTVAGTDGYISKFSDADSIVDSIIVEESGKIGIGVTLPKSKLDVSGGLKIADDADLPTADKVGTMRYREVFISGSDYESLCDMCMRTTSGYEWVNIVTNTFQSL